jgi:poly(A) polymerase
VAHADVPLALAAWAIDRHAHAGPLASPSIKELITRWRRALCLSNDESEHLSAILHAWSAMALGWPNASNAQRKRWSGSVWYFPSFTLLQATHPSLASQIDTEVQQLSSDGIGLKPPVWVDGDRLVAEGFRPGPAFKSILDRVYDAQLEGLVRSPEQAMELARKLSV